MKRIEWKWLCGFLLLAWLTTTANAESPREQFRQMIEQLQRSPTDDVLRENPRLMSNTRQIAGTRLLPPCLRGITMRKMVIPGASQT